MQIAINGQGQLPSKKHEEDAGYDISVLISSEESDHELLGTITVDYISSVNEMKEDMDLPPVFLDGELFFDKDKFDDEKLYQLLDKNFKILLPKFSPYAQSYKEKNGTYLFSTGIHVSLPASIPGRVAMLMVVPRSGLATKHCLGVVNSPGILDKPYLGELKVCLENRGSGIHIISNGARVAQAIITDAYNFGSDLSQYVISYEEFQQITTSRGTSGWGSTGV